MKTTKRILAGVLMACMLLSMMIPAAFAADDGVLKYRFGTQIGDVYPNPNSESTQKNFNDWDAENELSFYWEKNHLPSKETTAVQTDAEQGYFKSSFLNTSQPTRGFQTYYSNANTLDSGSTIGRYFNSRISSTSHWFALKIYDLKADTYTPEFLLRTMAEDTTVHVVSYEDYSDAIAANDEKPGKTDLSNPQSVITYLQNNDLIVATDTLESITESKTMAVSQKINNVTFPEDGDYVLLFTNGKTVGLFGLTMTPVVESYEASIGNEKFDTLESALLSDISVNSTVVLLNDATVEETLTVKAGVTLDLNGNTLIAANVTANFDGANIVDSSEGDTGVVKVSGTMLLDEGNDELPLYDSAEGGYRFFEGSVKPLGTKSDPASFWFTLEFAENSADAFALLAAGESKLEIKAEMKVGDTTFNLDFKNFVKKLGEEAPKAPEGQVAALYLNLINLDQAQGKTITLTPTVSCAGASVTAVDTEGKLNFTVPAEA